MSFSWFSKNQNCLIFKLWSAASNYGWCLLQAAEKVVFVSACPCSFCIFWLHVLPKVLADIFCVTHRVFLCSLFFRDGAGFQAVYRCFFSPQQDRVAPKGHNIQAAIVVGIFVYFSPFILRNWKLGCESLLIREIKLGAEKCQLSPNEIKYQLLTNEIKKN